MCIVVASFARLDQLVIVLATGSMTVVWVVFRPPMPVIVVVRTVLPCESRASVAVDSRVIVVPSASFWMKVTFLVAEYGLFRLPVV